MEICGRLRICGASSLPVCSLISGTVHACLERMYSHNKRVSARRGLGLVLCLALAGCSSPRQRPPDFTVVSEPELAAPEPAPATPAVPPVTPVPSTPRAVAPVARPQQPAMQFTSTWVPLDAWCRANGFPPPRRVSSDLMPAY